MKKIVLLSIVFVGLVFFNSCEKENLQSFEKKNSKDIVVKNRSNQGLGGIHRTYFDNKPGEPGIEGIDYGCEPPAQSCFDDIVVYLPSIQDVLEDIIDNHNAGTNVVDNDIDIFSKNKKALSGVVFTKEDVDNLINGIYILKVRGGDKVLSKKEKNYYVFKEASTTRKVYPIQIRK